MTRRPIEAHVDAGAGDGSDAAADALRDVYALWSTGVAVLAAREDAHVYGMTIAAFTPVSIEPPLALVCVHDDAPLASVLMEGTACSLSILGEDQKRAANVFADRFAVPGTLLEDDRGVPVVADALARLVGRVRAIHDGGDHRIIVLALERVATGEHRPPLLYHDRSYGRMADP